MVVGLPGDVASLGVPRQVGRPLHGDEVYVLAGVEAVHVLHQEVVTVLHVDPQQRLLGEGILGEPEVVQVSARDRGHVCNDNSLNTNSIFPICLVDTML